MSVDTSRLTAEGSQGRKNEKRKLGTDLAALAQDGNGSHGRVWGAADQSVADGAAPDGRMPVVSLKVAVSAVIGFDGPHCWHCGYFANGGCYCKLFLERLPVDHDYRPLRVEQCLEAERKSDQLLLPGLDKR